MKIANCVLFAVACLMNVSMVLMDQTFPTPCSTFNVSPMENFDKDLYDGNWYMYQLYDFPSSVNYDCYLQVRTPNPNGTQTLNELLVNPGVQPELRFDGLLTFFPNNIGRFTYSTPSSSFTAVLDIISTDYVNYGIEWKCRDESGGSRCALFIMSRTPVVTDFIKNKINGILDDHNIDKTKLRTLQITSCPSSLLPGGGGLLGGLLGGIGGLLGGVLGVVSQTVGGLLEALLG